MSISDLIATEAEAVERNPAAAIKPGSKVTRGHQRARTLQVRLNAEEMDALALLAEQRGLPVSTLARDLLLAQLAGLGHLGQGANRQDPCRTRRPCLPRRLTPDYRSAAV